jgi:hypothetical protein
MLRASFLRVSAILAGGFVGGLLLGQDVPAQACSAGMASDGKLCVDRFEASVWSKPSGGVQYGVSSADYPCSANGQDCMGKIFARSVKGVRPSLGITWFQAQAALANVGKRLPTNAEWQLAAMGTPDAVASPGPDDCVTQGTGPDPTGTHVTCQSTWGIFDMVGNANEWVADWVPLSSQCLGWGGFSDDQMCFNGAQTSTSFPYPGALLRGGAYTFGTAAGPFAISDDDPKGFDSSFVHGFRGVK